MRLRSWLSDALRAFSQYKGRHRPPFVVPPWSERSTYYVYEDALWGEAIKRMAQRRSPALALQ